MNNYFKNFFSYLRFLKNLQYLGAGENNLTSLPNEIGKFMISDLSTQSPMLRVI